METKNNDKKQRYVLIGYLPFGDGHNEIGEGVILSTHTSHEAMTKSWNKYKGVKCLDWIYSTTLRKGDIVTTTENEQWVKKYE